MKLTEKEKIKTYAYAYKNKTESIKAKELFKLLEEETKKIYNKLNIKFVFTENEPYKNFEEMKSFYNENGYLKIYSGDCETQKFMSKKGNLKFRAIHDYLHIITNSDFSFKGEYKVYLESLKYYSFNCHRILKSEIVGQASYYLEFNKFPIQRGVLI